MVATFATTPKLLMGPGAILEVGAVVKRCGGRRCLVVTDPGLKSAGILARVVGLLEAAGIEATTFTGVEPDPRYQVAAECGRVARESRAECILGLGGGSSLDIAKVAAVVAGTGTEVRALFGVDTVPGPGLPCVMVPTTAGTGSEVTPIAILSDDEERLKKGIVSDFLYPRAALLDPELTLGLPPAVTAATGLDALIHAVEAYTSVRATRFTDLLATRAMELIHGDLRTAYAQGQNLAARANLLEGSLLAGMAFANAGVTAVHAFAYPLGAEFHVPHGVANSVMLLSVLRFNRIGNLRKFASLATIFGVDLPSEPLGARAARAIEAIRQLVEDVEVPTRLRDLGVPESALEGMAESAMKVTRLLANNPRIVQLEDAVRIYRDAY